MCERCGASLVFWGQALGEAGHVRVNSVSDSCVICDQSVLHGNSLRDGCVYHPQCYAELLSLIERQRAELAGVSARELEHRRTIERAGTWGYKIRAFFIGDEINVSDQVKAVTLLQAKVQELRQGVERTEQRIRELWDYWLEYPPDWEYRKRAVRDDVGVCERCGESERLQVHHRQRIATGGTHRPENLEVMCAYCHSVEHGRDLTEREIRRDSRLNAYGQRIDILRRAREHGLIVHFSYRKYDGERSTRSFKPQRFKRYGKSLCIEGWCYLRNDTRVFAISRMSRINIVPSN